MSNQYAIPNPFDKTGNSMTGFPVPSAKPAIATMTSDNATASAAITLNDNTTVVEVAVEGGRGAGIKWFGASAGNPSVVTTAAGANFDHFIPSGQVRRFVVPPSVMGTPSIVGMNKQNGLYPTVAFQTKGISSVMVTEY